MVENNWSDRDNAVMRGVRREVTKTPEFVQENCRVHVYGDELNAQFVSGKGRNKLVFQRDENDCVTHHWEKRQPRFAVQQEMKTHLSSLLSAGGTALAIGMKAS